jgi:hypothetical protein
VSRFSPFWQKTFGPNFTLDLWTECYPY